MPCVACPNKDISSKFWTFESFACTRQCTLLIMTSIIRVGQSKLVTAQIDEDSNERIMNCIQTLSELETQPAVHEVFLEDTKKAFSKMLGTQDSRGLFCFVCLRMSLFDNWILRNELQRKRKPRRRRLLLFRLMTCCRSVNSQEDSG
jgi:vesicle coat complex subunit